MSVHGHNGYMGAFHCQGKSKQEVFHIFVFCREGFLVSSFAKKAPTSNDQQLTTHLSAIGDKEVFGQPLSLFGL